MSDLIDIESKINSSIHNPNMGDIKNFKIIINTKEKTYRFSKITNEKYCKLIDVLDKINLNEINFFELIINNKMINQEIVNIKHYVNKVDDDDCYIYKDDNIYIEFLKDKYTTCCCYIKDINNTLLFNTPPNY